MSVDEFRAASSPAMCPARPSNAQVDIKNRRHFLKRTKYEELKPSLLFLGSVVTVFSRWVGGGAPAGPCRVRVCFCGVADGNRATAGRVPMQRITGTPSMRFQTYRVPIREVMGPVLLKCSTAVPLDDIHGAHWHRQLKLTEYGDEFTRNRMESQSERWVAVSVALRSANSLGGWRGQAARLLLGSRHTAHGNLWPRA